MENKNGDLIFTAADVHASFTQRIPLSYSGMGHRPTMGGCFTSDFDKKIVVTFVSGEYEYRVTSSRAHHDLKCTITPVQQWLALAEPLCEITLVEQGRFNGTLSSDIYKWLKSNAEDAPASLPEFSIGACYPGNGVVYRVTGELASPNWEKDGYESESDSIENGYSYAPAINATWGGLCTLEFFKRRFCGEARKAFRT